MRQLAMLCLLLPTILPAQAPAELAAAVDAFVLDRWSNADPAPLVAKLRAAKIDATGLEAMLRAGRPAYPPVAEPRGKLSDRLPLPSDHFDHTTEHYVYVPKSYDPAEPTPLVVIAHGGSAARGSVRRDDLAEHGIVSERLRAS
jgi:acetyl esterase/lipase